MYQKGKRFGAPEYNICRTFGCGAKLSLREQLFGNTCTKHNTMSTDLIGGSNKITHPIKSERPEAKYSNKKFI